MSSRLMILTIEGISRVYTLVKKQIRLDVRKYSFSRRTINVLNKLSTDCVHATSVDMFKNKIHKLKGHCIEFKYYADGIHSGLTPPG